jgi:pilus assembly protein CpaE
MHNPGEKTPFGAAAFERPVPRISIHAFCEFPDTAAALQRAGSDRRLAKAQLMVQLGGVGAAIDYYAGQATPNLLIVESRTPAEKALAEIDRLAEVCDASTKVVVIGRTNDVELYRELMHRGVSEYLVAPLSPLKIIEAVSGLYADPEGNPVGKVIAFVGARGGVGASSLAHNVGWCIAEELNIGTAIIDFDLPFGTLGIDYNEDPGQTVLDALQAPQRLDETLLERLLLKRGENLALFPAPAILDREIAFGPDVYEAVIDAVRRILPCVVLDLPHSWEAWVRASLIGADDIVLVAAPDLSSLRNAKNIVESLKVSRPNDELPKLVLNQVGISRRPEIPVKDFAETVGYEPVEVLPFDAEGFGNAANNGKVLVEIDRKSQAAAGIRSLARMLTGRKSLPEKAGNPLAMLFKPKKRA